MSSLLRSLAHFTSRAAFHGLTAEHIQKCEAAGVANMSAFASSSSYTPGSSDSKAFEDTVKKILDIADEPPLAVMAAFRGLHFECFTVVASSLRDMVEKDGSQTRRTPQAERVARLGDQRKRLCGLDISGELEPSYRLCDMTSSMADDNHIVWVPWQKCTRRDKEVEAGPAQITELSLDKDGRIKSLEKDMTVADLSTPLKVRAALLRRSLAFDQAGILAFSVQSQWVEKLMRLYQGEVPPGFTSPTLEQLRLAYRELFSRLNRLTVGNVRPLPDGTRPADKVMVSLINDPEVVYYLLPLAAAARSTAHAGEQAGDLEDKGEQKKKKAARRRGRQQERDEQPPLSIPPWMKDKALKDENGRPFCYNFNRGPDYCKEKVDASTGMCRRGLHLAAPDKGPARKKQRT